MKIPNFDFYSMIVPDVLHEVELGTWKAYFTHILRILNTLNADLVQIVNQR